MRSETALDVTIEINVKQFFFFLDILTNEQHSANSS